MSIDVLRNPPDSEPKKFLSGALALSVHILFIVMMVFGLSWKSHPPEGMVVELWSELPKPISEPVTPAKPSKPVPEPVKAKPVEPPKHLEPVKPEPAKSEPIKPAPVPKDITPPVKKPEIELKQKPEPIKEIKPDLEELKKKEEAEKLKKLEEQKKEQERKQELEKKKALEQQKEIEKQKELQKQKELAAQKQKEQEAKEAKARREAEAQRAAQQAAAGRLAGEIEKYKAMIRAKIRSRTVMPPDLPGNPKVEFMVTLLPGGDVLDVRLSKSSGHPVFDSAVERAIFLSKPLPVPPDPVLFKDFRALNIEVHYRE